MKGLLETVATQTEESDLEIPWKTLTNNIYCEGVGKGGRQRKLNVFSRDKQGVAITVIIDFPGLGHYNQTFELPDDNLFKMVCSAKTLGWPLWLEPLSRWTPKCLWPHHDKIHWPNQSNTEEALRIIAFHRALDILGVLAAVGAGSGFLLAVDVISICAGHRLDTEMLRQIKEEDLRPVTVG